MSALIEVPRKILENVANLRLPQRADRRLQTLMDRNTNGALTDSEKDELAALVEMSESLLLVRAEALHALGHLCLEPA